MHKIDGAGHVNNMFVAEDASINRPPTEITADFMNAIMMEIVNVVNSAGIVLSKANNGQLLQALEARFASLDPGGDYATKSAVQMDDYKVADADVVGAPDAIVASFFPAITALASAHGMTLYVRALAANATVTPTFTPNNGTIAAKNIVKGNNLALAVGDIAGAGYWMALRYDLTIDKWVLLNPAKGIYVVESKLPGGYRHGLSISNNAVSPDTAIDIASGYCRSIGDDYDMALLGAWSKILQLSGSWAAGNAQNGLFSGVRANNTWYHVFLIRKDADGSIDAGFDTSITASNRPGGYSAYRRLGAIKTDASGNIRGFYQAGQLFLFKAPVTDMSSVALSTASTQYTISTPPGIKCLAKLFPTILGNESQVYIRDPDAADLTPAVPFNQNIAILSGTTNETLAAEIHIMTNISSQIAVKRASTNAVDMTLMTHGWFDFSL